MTKYRHLFLPSEYQIALHNYRRARRRGDPADAQRWLKTADMHLRVAHRFRDGVYKSRARDRELAAADRVLDAPPPDAKRDIYAARAEFDDIKRQVRAHIAEKERERRAAIAPAEGSGSAGET